MGRDPVKALLVSLCRYLRDRGRMVLSLAEGQKTLRMALRGLWRRYEAGELGYTYLVEAYNELLERGSLPPELAEAGIIELIEYEGEPYLLVDPEKLARFYREKCPNILGEG